MCYMTDFIVNGTGIQKSGGEISAEVRVPSDAVWFDGHFPGMPVLPGIAQLALVVEILGQALGKPVSVSSFSRVRFKQAIMPSEPVGITITPNESDAASCTFRLVKNGELACSGFFKMANFETKR